MKGDARSHGLWEASAPPPPSGRRLDGDIEVDVAIVGGGFTGMSAALHCAEGGALVAVLEAVEVGYGGSGRNVGLVNAGMWVLPEQLPKELGPVYGNRLLKLLGEAPSLVFDIVNRHGIKCEAINSGTLHCAVGNAGQAEIAERARQWLAVGAPVRLLSAGETAEQTGAKGYTGALLDARAGTIQPLAYARGLAHAAVGAGVKLFCGEEVTSADSNGGAWSLRTQSGHTVRARKVVIATNAYTPVGSPWKGIQSELVKLPYFNLATRPLPEELRKTILPQRRGAWDTAEILSSFRMDQAGRLVFGSVGALRGPALSVHRNWGQRAMAKLFPQLKGIGFEYEWYGWIGMTKNNLPRLHRFGDNAYSFSGYNGRGIAPGTTFGRQLSQLMLDACNVSELALPVTDIQAQPFRGVKSQFFEQGAVLAHAVTARI